MQTNIFTKLKEIIRKIFFKKFVSSDYQNKETDTKLSNTIVEPLNPDTDKNDIVANAFTKVPDYVVKRYRTRGS